VGGYLFVILFCIMAYSMSQRLAGLGITGHLPLYLVLHIVLVLALLPLLLLKILFARRYKQSHSSLKALGVTIFVVSFVSCSSTRRRFVRLPPGALCWNWQRKMGCRFRMAAARAYAVRALRES